MDTNKVYSLQEAYQQIYQPEYLSEEVEIATEYFYEMGLNENGVDILIEELGEEEFVEWVFDIAEEYTLIEARAGGVKVEPVTAKGKQIQGKPSASSLKRLRRLKAERTAREQSASSSKSSGMRDALRSQAASSAASKQGKSGVANVKDAIGKRVAAAKDFVQKGAARHQQAVGDLKKKVEPAAQTAAKTAQTAGLAAKRAAQVTYAAGHHLGQTPAGKAAKKKGSELLAKAGAALKQRAAQDTEKVRKWITKEEYEFILSYLIDEGYANTVENAEYIIASMSENWIENIIEEYKDFPTAKVTKKAGDLMGSSAGKKDPASKKKEQRGIKMMDTMMQHTPDR